MRGVLATGEQRSLGISFGLDLRCSILVTAPCFRSLEHTTNFGAIANLAS